MPQKIVINASFGRFAISRKAMVRMQKKGYQVDEYDVFNLQYKPTHAEDFGDIYGDKIPRDHPLLVEVVQFMGPELASGFGAYLKIVEIPDDVEWEINEEKGREWVAEKHRTWR